MRRPVAIAIALSVICGFFAGCDGGARSRLGQRVLVKGKVTAGGKVLTQGFVVLTPVDPAKGDEQTGQIGPDGAYVTSVFPGKYKVSVTGTRLAPAKYQTAQSTDLAADVPSSNKEGLDFNLN
jgi:hypothetical protein